MTFFFGKQRKAKKNEQSLILANKKDLIEEIKVTITEYKRYIQSSDKQDSIAEEAIEKRSSRWMRIPKYEILKVQM